MRKLLPWVMSMLFAAAPILTEARSASDESKDDDRLRNCGTVLKEILDVADNIPHDLLDQADCVVEGSTIRPDDGDNRRIYGRKIPARDIVLSGTVAVPPAARQMISTLDTKTPRHRP